MSTGERRRPWRPPWLDWGLAFMLIGSAERVRRWSLDRPLWLDEQFIAINIRARDAGALAGDLLYGQSAPLGWLWAERAVLVMAGSGERALKFVPLLFGVGTLVVAWLVGRRWLGRLGTAVLVGLCAVTPMLLRYSDELKQYSADTFWVLALVGLAAWAAEKRGWWRSTAWWGAAAAACWLSMAAILVTPALGTALVLIRWRTDGWRAAVLSALPGTGWLACFTLHYDLALRYAVSDPLLTTYWSHGVAPAGAGPGETLAWIVARARGLAVEPVGLHPGYAVPLWIIVLIGLVAVTARRPVLGVMVTGAVASGFALALIRVAPLTGRLALWLAPLLFLAVAAAAQAGLRAARLAGAAAGRDPTPGARAPGSPGPDPARVAFGLTVLAVAAMAAGGAMTAFRPSLAGAVTTPGIQGGVDDRAAVGFLVRRHRAGDVVLLGGSSTTASNWYDPDGRLVPRRQFILDSPGADCDPRRLTGAVRGADRALAYYGYRFETDLDVDRVVGAHLTRLGRVVEVRHFGHGTVWVVDLRSRPGTASAHRVSKPDDRVICVR